MARASMVTRTADGTIVHKTSPNRLPYGKKSLTKNQTEIRQQSDVKPRQSLGGATSTAADGSGFSPPRTY